MGNVTGAGDSAAIPTLPKTVETKRLRRSKLEKRRIVEATLAPGASVARVARAHGVNANQVFQWRRLYQRGLLEVEAATAELLPVRVSDPVEATVQRQRCSRTACSGSIQVEVRKARLRIEGNADPQSLRMVLECLLG
jgi:transposase